jgi:hypothetical protein
MTSKEYLKKLQEDLQRQQIQQGEPASIQGALKNFGAEVKSFFGGPDAQAKSRDTKKEARDEAVTAYDNNLRVEENRAAGGSELFNSVGRATNSFESSYNAKQLMDAARGPIAPSLDAGVELGAAAPRSISPEGSLKADQLLAAASEPMTLDGVVDDVLANGREGKFQPAGETPKAQDFLDKQDEGAPKFNPATLVTKDSQGNYVRDEDPKNIMMAQRGFNRNQRDLELRDRTDKRKDFASTLDAANYDPSTASSEDKANFYAQGKELGLSSKQIDKYANDQLTKNAKSAAERTALSTRSGGAQGSSSGVSTDQSRKGVQGAKGGVQGASSQVQGSASMVSEYSAGRGSSLRQESKRISKNPTPRERRAEEEKKKRNA